VLDDGQRTWSAPELDHAVGAATARLRGPGTRVLATLLDNGAAFVALDEAALQAGLVHVPLPLFFTPAQMQHALQAAGVDTLVAAAGAGRGLAALPWWPVTRWPASRWCTRACRPPRWRCRRTRAKITFTSGTTGCAQGRVPERGRAMQRVAQGLVEAMAPLAHRAPPVCAALCRAAGEHRRPDGAAPARAPCVTLPLASWA
jgi:long-chain acyl-CoA synthetase